MFRCLHFLHIFCIAVTSEIQQIFVKNCFWTLNGFLVVSMFGFILRLAGCGGALFPEGDGLKMLIFDDFRELFVMVHDLHIMGSCRKRVFLFEKWPCRTFHVGHRVSLLEKWTTSCLIFEHLPSFPSWKNEHYIVHFVCWNVCCGCVLACLPLLRVRVSAAATC